MKMFRRLLKERQGLGPGDRRWLFVPYDQLSGEMGPLARERPRELGIVLIENRWQLSRRPFHRQRLAHIIASQRQFSLEQAERGVAVRYEVAEGPYRENLAGVAKEVGRLRVMEPAEREMRVDIAPLAESGALEIIPHEGWLTSRAQFRAARSKVNWPRKSGHLVRLPGQRIASRRPPGSGSPETSATAADCRRLRCTRTASYALARAGVGGRAGPVRT